MNTSSSMLSFHSTGTEKEVKKLSKYKDLEIKIGQMWNLKTPTIPIVIGALGLINKGVAKNVT